MYKNTHYLLIVQYSDILQITTINCFNKLLLNQHTSKPYEVACTLDGGCPLVQTSTNNVTELIEKAGVTSICSYHLSLLSLFYFY